MEAGPGGEKCGVVAVPNALCLLRLRGDAAKPPDPISASRTRSVSVATGVPLLLFNCMRSSTTEIVGCVLGSCLRPACPDAIRASGAPILHFSPPEPPDERRRGSVVRNAGYG